MLIEQAKARLANAAGVYTSDVKGHLLILDLHPVRVSCASCLETIDRSKFKNLQDFKTGADAFIAKHGALDIKIATNIGEIVEEYLAKKCEQGYVFDKTGRCVGFVPDIFEVNPDLIDGTDKE